MSRDDRIFAGYVAVVACAYLVLALLGITQSSIGTSGLQTDGQTSSGVVFGDPRPIRGDEFSRSSPFVLGEAASGDSDFYSPLGQDPSVTATTANYTLFEHIVFFDRSLVQAAAGLPDDMQFAAYWWLWVAVTAVALPLLLRFWGVPLPLMLLGTAAILISPSNAWWSNSPVQPVALSAVVASAIGLAWKNPGRWRPAWLIGLALIGALCLARLPFAYLPFSLPIAAAIIIPTFMMGVARKQTRRVTVLFSVAVVALGGALALGVILENQAAFEALNNTLYPGERRSTGQLLNLGFVFGAPFLGLLQSNPELVGTNQSELSTGWSFLAVPALIVAAARRPAALQRVAAIALAFILGCMFSWVLYNWPQGIGTAIPLVSAIPPQRMAAVLGIPAVLAIVVSLTSIWDDAGPERPSRFRTPLTVAAAVLFLLLIAGSTLQTTYLPGLTPWLVLRVALYASLCLVALMVKHPSVRAVGAALAVLGMSATVWRAAPLMDGLGDIRNSTAATTVVNLAGGREPGDGYWAADAWPLSTLLTSNGIPSLSGDQWTGPSDQWLVLDPDRRFETAWNRGASVVSFVWDPTATQPTISNPQSDQIVITVSPCDPALQELDLKYIITQQELEAPCLTSVGQFRFSGTEVQVYEIAKQPQLPTR